VYASVCSDMHFFLCTRGPRCVLVCICVCEGYRNLSYISGAMEISLIPEGGWSGGGGGGGTLGGGEEVDES